MNPLNNIMISLFILLIQILFLFKNYEKLIEQQS